MLYRGFLLILATITSKNLFPVRQLLTCDLYIWTYFSISFLSGLNRYEIVKTAKCLPKSDDEGDSKSPKTPSFCIDWFLNTPAGTHLSSSSIALIFFDQCKIIRIIANEVEFFLIHKIQNKANI